MCRRRITGRPTENIRCFVLCRNRYIPSILPRLPPITATNNSVASGMRQRFLMARRLSDSISMNPAALIRSRYRCKKTMAITFLEADELKRMFMFVLLSVLLCGCGVQDFETVMDTQPVLTPLPAAAIVLELPQEAALAVFENDTGGKIYLCDGYEITVQTLPGGDLERTLQEVTGFSKDRLTLMRTEQDGSHRYDCVWSSAGEQEQRIGRLSILDDGKYHYAVGVMADASLAESLQDKLDNLFRSFSLVSTEQ